MVFVDVIESSGAKLAAAGVAVGSTASLPTPDPFPEEVVRVPAGILLASVSGAALYVSNEYISADQSVARQELLTATVATFPATETALEQDVRLVAGGVESAYDPRVGETLSHGFGWEYIQATSDVTKEEIEYVLTHNPTVTHRGDRTIIIGQNAEEEEIILTIIGGFLLAADRYHSTKEGPDDCGGTVHYDRENLEEHIEETEKKRDVQVDDLIDAVKNPSEIWDSDLFRYYIGKFGSKYHITKITKNNPFFDLVINTVLLDNGELYDSLEEAREQLEKRQPDEPEKVWPDGDC